MKIVEEEVWLSFMEKRSPKIKTLIPWCDLMDEIKFGNEKTKTLARTLLLKALRNLRVFRRSLGLRNILKEEKWSRLRLYMAKKGPFGG